MKRNIALFSLIAFSLVVMFASIALSQPGANGPTAAGVGQEAAKSRILVAVNRAELSLEQLQTLQGIVQATVDGKDAVRAAQQELQEFLVAWTGTSEAFEVAFEAEQQKVKAAAEAFKTLKAGNSKTIKDMLSASQFEVLEPVLISLTGRSNPNPRAQGQGADDDRPQIGNRGPDNDHRPQGRQGTPHLRGFGGGRSGNLDVLNEVLTEKIAALG